MREQIRKTTIEIAAIILLIAAVWFAFEISVFSSLSEADSKFWLSTSELLLIISAIFVAVGIVGEWPDSEAWKKRLLYKLAKFAVAIGIVGELLGDAGVFRAGDKLQEIQGKEIAVAVTNAGAANERAAKLEKEANLARLALERLKTPRTLGPDRQRFVADAVRKYAPQRYAGAVSSAADDGIEYWESIYDALFKAGWVVVPMAPDQPGVGNNPKAGIPIAAMPGVEILIDPTKKEEVGPAALALGEALHADGTIVHVSTNDQSNPIQTDRDILLIRIGARVPPQ